ncbi:MAG: HIT domain-containing protein [Hyphomonadaceae bacterium]|jgi:diadenosine tetraphosphate (Ap4A) HIT family hydrolase|nr:HIT domain-containing protein [Hyphomonadaceae bacterium]
MDFSLDPRLAADTLFAAQFPLCEVRVMNEARYPWLVAVPRLPDAVELFGLASQDGEQAWAEIQALGALVGGLPGVGKVNIGALGNMVRQLHVHIVGRHEGDPAWPGPVWGHSPAKPYGPDEASVLIGKVAALAKRF